MSKCDYILSTGERLDYNEMREHLLNNYENLIEKKIPPPPISSGIEFLEPTNGASKVRKTFKTLIERESKLTDTQRKILFDSPEYLYTVLPTSTSKEIALSLIKEIGVTQALELARTDKSLTPVERVMIFGGAINFYANQSKIATQNREKTKIAEMSDGEIAAYEEFKKATEDLAKLGTAYGRAISAFKGIYKLSNIGIKRAIERIIDENSNITQEEVNNRVNELRNQLEKNFFDLKEQLEKNLEEKVKEGVSAEVKKIFDKMPSDKKEKVNKFIEAIRKHRKDIQSRTYDATLGIPAAIYSGALLTLENGLMVGLSVHQAIELAINKIKEKYSIDNEKEDSLRKQFIDILGVTPIKVGNITLSNKTTAKLVDSFIKNNGITNEEIIRIAGKKLGVEKISENDLKIIEKASEVLSQSDVPYFIERQNEEIIQRMYEKYGNLLYHQEVQAYTFANQLSGLFNQVINSLGFLRTISTAFTVAIKTKKPISAIKVLVKEVGKSKNEAATILSGRVSRGASFKDYLTKTGTGEISVRYLEYMEKNGFLRKLAIATRVKYVPRTLEAIDTFSSAASSGLTEFWKITNYVDKFYSQKTAKEKKAIVWDIMYGIDREKETEKAIIDLKRAGVENPTNAEINRTINERLIRNRDKKLNEEYNKIAIQIANDLKASGQTDEIAIKKAVAMALGDFESVVARGQRQAQRETGKLSTYGLTSLVSVPYDAATIYLNKKIRESKGLERNIAVSGSFIANKLFPFASSIARWTEMQIELTPYGAIKGLGYKIASSKYLNKGKSESELKELSELGDDYFIRFGLGIVYVGIIFAGLDLIKSDDDDEQSAVGLNKFSDSFAKERVAGVGRPKQSFTISKTRKLPLQLLGNAGVAYGWYSDFYANINNYNDEDKIRGLSIVSAAFSVTANTALESSWTQSYGRYSNIIENISKESSQNKLGTIAGRLISTLVPWNRTQTELAQVMNPQTKESDNFYINMANQFSVVRGFGLGKSSFDYRGRNYDYGDIWVNSADGLVKMISGKKYRDEIDVFLSKINFAASEPYQQTKSDELTKYSIFNEDGTIRTMTNEEWYDFRKISAENFNKKITQKWQKIDQKIESISGSESEKKSAKREAVSILYKESKDEAILELNKRNISENKLIKLRAKKEAEKAKSESRFEKAIIKSTN